MKENENTAMTDAGQQQPKSGKISANKKNLSEVKPDERSEITIITERIEGTPFMSRWEKDKGWSFGMGTKKISPWYETREEMMEEIKKGTNNWELLTTIITLLAEWTMEEMKTEIALIKQRI